MPKKNKFVCCGIHLQPETAEGLCNSPTKPREVHRSPDKDLRQSTLRTTVLASTSSPSRAESMALRFRNTSSACWSSKSLYQCKNLCPLLFTPVEQVAVQRSDQVCHRCPASCPFVTPCQSTPGMLCAWKLLQVYGNLSG